MSSIALSATLSHLAVGLGDGTVLLYRFLDQFIFSTSTSLTSLPKPKTIHESPTEPITALGFKEPATPLTIAPTNGASAPNPNLNPQAFDAHHTRTDSEDPSTNAPQSAKEAQNLYLFIVTTNHVLAYQASGRGSGGTSAVVDEVGAGLGCAVMDWHKRGIVVARDEAVYVCGVGGRGTSFAYEGVLFLSGSILCSVLIDACIVD